MERMYSPLWKGVGARVFSPALMLCLCCLFVLSACGFHLRGAVDLPEAMEVTAIQGGTGQLRNNIRNALLSAGAEVVSEESAAASRLLITGEESERRVLSVDSSGRAREYELFYQIRYSLHGPDGTILVPEQSVKMIRGYAYDPDNVLSSEQEESAIRNEMRQMAIRQMLRRIRTTLQQGSGQTSGEGAGAEVPADEVTNPEIPASGNSQTIAQ